MNVGPTPQYQPMITNSPETQPRAHPPPHIRVQLGLAYMLHRSNFEGNEFEHGRGEHIQPLSIHTPRDFNNPFRVPNPHSDFISVRVG